MLFAEATTGDGNRLLRFRSSHFEAVRQAISSERGSDAVVQPMFLDYSRIAGMPVGRRERALVAWCGDMTFFARFQRLLGAGGIDCKVYFGAPIRVSADSDRKTIARLTETMVRDLAERARGAKSAILAGAGSS